MAQWLGSPAALPEDVGSIPSTHMVAHNHLYCNSSSMASETLFWPQQVLDVHVRHRVTPKKNTHTNKIIIIINMEALMGRSITGYSVEGGFSRTVKHGST
jgi:hypothetical protein